MVFCCIKLVQHTQREGIVYLKPHQQLWQADELGKEKIVTAVVWNYPAGSEDHKSSVRIPAKTYTPEDL